MFMVKLGNELCNHRLITFMMKTGNILVPCWVTCVSYINVNSDTITDVQCV